MGPFRPNEDGSLSYNQYSWNRLANMVFIESPTGVGFSYSENVEDYNAGDESTAADNYAVIQAFLNRFPERRTNPLYITSESYGGHYIPTLAKKIVDENKSPSASKPVLNFKGFAVGNPYITVQSGTSAMLDTFWGHQIVSKLAYERYNSLCNSNETAWYSAACSSMQDELFESIGNVNPYALSYPVCLLPGSGYKATAEKLLRAFKESASVSFTGEGSHDMRGKSSSLRTGSAQALRLLNHIYGNLPQEQRGKMINLPYTQQYEPCEGVYSTSYLNKDTVKDALHVTKDIVWSECSE